MELLVKNGFVYDPLNKVEGEMMDIHVRDGKVVDSVSSSADVVDASGMIVMPGGVDLHSHIAGSKVNVGRLLRPEDHYGDVVPKTPSTRSGVGHSVPSTFVTGYRYAEMGYTTVFEPATPPLKTFHTHEELNDIPIVDKACFPLFGNNWVVMEKLRDGKLNECAAYVAWMLKVSKGYAIKIVNPGGIEAWGWGKNLTDMDDEVPNFGVTPREIVRGLCKVNQVLGLPHPIHVHPINIGNPGNYRTTLETMRCVEDLAKDGKPCIHITHVQFLAYGGVDWLSISSRADDIAAYVNNHSHVTVDMGQVIFGDTTTMTADGPFQYRLYQITHNKWVNADVEAETGAGIVPITYVRKNYVHAVMWAIGLELALLVKDPWKVYLTTDHPNGGPFTEYPRVISWLMSNKVRQRIIKRIPRLARVRSNIKDIDREMTFSEIAIISRAATAKALGLKDKGHLGVGADADISIYRINPKTIDPSSQYREIRRAFRRAAYTIKGGEVVARDGEVVKAPTGRTFWVDPQVPQDRMAQTVSELKERFEDLYTVRFANYGVSEMLLPRSTPILAQSEL
jgi:formylmethanofuran dehydrogenase subunit A